MLLPRHRRPKVDIFKYPTAPHLFQPASNGIGVVLVGTAVLLRVPDVVGTLDHGDEGAVADSADFFEVVSVVVALEDGKDIT